LKAIHVIKWLISFPFRLFIVSVTTKAIIRVVTLFRFRNCSHIHHQLHHQHHQFNINIISSSSTPSVHHQCYQFNINTIKFNINTISSTSTPSVQHQHHLIPSNIQHCQSSFTGILNVLSLFHIHNLRSLFWNEFVWGVVGCCVFSSQAHIRELWFC